LYRDKGSSQSVLQVLIDSMKVSNMRRSSFESTDPLLEKPSKLKRTAEN